ncbi:MAG: hypothetical protein MI922_08575 [Bacteroidales bacterium]|nr:hypothetical protein [Bacteroidales bacterium]
MKYFILTIILLLSIKAVSQDKIIFNTSDTLVVKINHIRSGTTTYIDSTARNNERKVGNSKIYEIRLGSGEVIPMMSKIEKHPLMFTFHASVGYKSYSLKSTEANLEANKYGIGPEIGYTLKYSKNYRLALDVLWNMSFDHCKYESSYDNSFYGHNSPDGTIYFLRNSTGLRFKFGSAMNQRYGFAQYLLGHGYYKETTQHYFNDTHSVMHTIQFGYRVKKIKIGAGINFSKNKTFNEDFGMDYILGFVL